MSTPLPCEVCGRSPLRQGPGATAPSLVLGARGLDEFSTPGSASAALPPGQHAQVRHLGARAWEASRAFGAFCSLPSIQHHLNRAGGPRSFFMARSVARPHFLGPGSSVGWCKFGLSFGHSTPRFDFPLHLHWPGPAEEQGQDIEAGQMPSRALGSRRCRPRMAVATFAMVSFALRLSSGQGGCHGK